MKKLTYEHVKQQIESIDGYKLLSKEYINNRTKVLVRCPLGHKFDVLLGNFQQGTRCPSCHGNIRHSIEYIREQIESFGYKLLSKEYTNNKTKLLIQCDKGHIYETRYDVFKNGKRCPYCNNGVVYTYEYIKEQIESVDGYKLISKEYVNSITKLSIQCDKGHIYETTWSIFNLGCRCSKCDNRTSKPEIEIQEYIKSFNKNVICNDRTQILNPLTGYYLELDVWLPELNKAIEFNGKYWHSFDDAMKRDYIKQEECDILGINLLIIHEKNYNINKNKEFNRIRKFLNDAI